MSESRKRMLELLLSQFEDKKVLTAILKMIAKEYEYHHQLRKDIREKTQLAVAVGAQLDMCGEVADINRQVEKSVSIDFFGFPDHGDNTFGEARFYKYGEPYLTSTSLGDTEYRLAIYSKIAKNTTDGSRISTINSIKKMFSLSKVVAVNAGDAKIRVGIGRIVNKNELSIIEALDLIIRSAGVGIIYLYWFNGGNTFGFSKRGKNKGNFAPMGKGVFARIMKIEGSLI